MRWTTTPEKDTATVALAKRFWDASDKFGANPGPRRQEYFGPTLGVIFLRFAERLRGRRLRGYDLCSGWVCS